MKEKYKLLQEYKDGESSIRIFEIERYGGREVTAKQIERIYREHKRI